MTKQDERAVPPGLWMWPRAQRWRVFLSRQLSFSSLPLRRWRAGPRFEPAALSVRKAKHGDPA